MSHTCSTLIIHCIDFRLGKPIKEYLGKQGLLGDCDIVSIAGATQNLVSPKNPSDVDLVLRQIDIATRLHNIQKVILMNHTDCGAYGGRSAFSSQEEENTSHVGDMQKAASIITEKYPTIAVECILADIHEDGEVNFITK